MTDQATIEHDAENDTSQAQPASTPADTKPNPPAQPDRGDTPKARTYTEDEVNAMITSRLSKNERSVRKSIEDEQAETKRQAELTAMERAKEAEQKAAQTIKEYEQRAITAERIAALSGKVTRPERVLKLMDDPDRYFKDGKPIDKVLADDFPEYLPRSTAPQPENTPARSGQSIDDMIRSRARGG